MFWFGLVFVALSGGMLWHSTHLWWLLAAFVSFHSASVWLLFRADPPKPRPKVLAFALTSIAFAIVIFVFANQFAKESTLLWLGAICSCDASMNFLNHRTELRGPAS